MPYKKQKSYKKTKSKSKKGRLHQKRSTKKIQHRKNRKIMLGGGGALVSFDEFVSALKKYDATDALLKIYKYRLVLPVESLGQFKQAETINGCMTDHKNEVDITELEQKLLLDDKDFDELVTKLNLNDQEKQEWKAMFDKVKAVFDRFREPKNTTNNLTTDSSSLTNPIPIQEDPIVGVNPTRGMRKDINDDDLLNKLIKHLAVQDFLERYSSIYNDGNLQVKGQFLVFGLFVQDYNNRFNQGKAETLYKFNTGDLFERLGLNDDQVKIEGKSNDPKILNLQKALAELSIS